MKHALGLILLERKRPGLPRLLGIRVLPLSRNRAMTRCESAGAERHPLSAVHLTPVLRAEPVPRCRGSPVRTASASFHKSISLGTILGRQIRAAVGLFQDQTTPSNGE